MKHIIIIIVLVGSLSMDSLKLSSQEFETPLLTHTIQSLDTRLVSWSPTKNWIAFDTYSYSPFRGFVRIMDLTTLQTLLDIQANGIISFAWNIEGTQIAILSRKTNSFELTIWNFVIDNQSVEAEEATTLEIEWTIYTDDAMSSIAWHPQEPVIALGDGSELYFIHLDTHELERVEAGGLGVATVAWSPRGQYLAVGTALNSLRVVNYETRENILALTANDLPGVGSGIVRPKQAYQRTQSLAWSPNESAIALFYSETDIRGIYTIDISSQTIQANISNDSKEQVQAIAWSPNGNMIATVGGELFCERNCNNTTYIWDAKSLSLLHLIEEHTDIVTTVSWSLDSQMLATGSQDNTIRIWEIPRND